MIEPILTLPIVYSGKDTDLNRINAIDLGYSLIGFSKIVRTAFYLVDSREYKKRFSEQDQKIKIYTEPFSKGSFGVKTIIDWASQTEMYSGMIGNIITGVLGFTVAYFWNKKEEMKAYKELVMKMLHQNKEKEDRFFSLMEAFALGQKKNTKRLVEPIGRTCSKIKIGSEDQNIPELDQNFKESLLQNKDELTEEQPLIVLISELDLKTGSCKITLAESSNEEGTAQNIQNRIPARITDPALMIANNEYAIAFAAKKYLSVRAKSLLRDGELSKVFISNISQNES